MANTAPKKRSPAALAVAMGILFSRIAGLVRERVFAYYLGNSDAAGAFRAALRIPNLLQNLFGEGVLSASFIPVYARLLAEGKEEEAGKVAGITLSLLALVVALLVSVGVFASPFLIEILAPGFTGDVRDLTITLVQILFPGMGLLVLSAWCLGILNSHRQFFLSYVAPVLWNLAMIVLLFAVGAKYAVNRDGQMRLVVLLSWSTVVGSALQFFVQLPAALKLNGGLKPGLSVTFAPIALVIRNFVPAILSRGVVQLSAYIDQILSSFLGPQVVSAMAYSQTIYLLPISLFGMAISSSELPEMARTLGNPNEKAAALKERLTRGLQRMSYYIVPSAMAFFILGDVVAATLLQTGQFKSTDSFFVWYILGGSAVGLLAVTQSRLCISLFWALHDTKTPAYFAILHLILTAVLGYAVVFPLREKFGWEPVYCASALVTTASLAGWVELLCIRYSLIKKVGHFSMGYRRVVKFALVALIAAVASHFLHTFLPPIYPALKGVLALGVYGILYLSGTRLLGCPEALEALGPVRRLFRSRSE